MKRSIVAGIGVTVLLGAVVAAVSSPAQATPRTGSSASAAAKARAELRDGTLAQHAGLINVCQAHHLACNAIILAKSKHSSSALAFKPAVGYGARELQKAYGLHGAASRHGTITVIGAGAYPTLQSDLNVYRSTYGLPACTTGNGCFTQLNYKGNAPYSPTTHKFLQFGEEEIAVETALDVDMASAACPKCKIISLQVPLKDGFFGNKKHIDNAILHFATAVQTAHRLGATSVSISYGYPTDKYSNSGTIAKMMRVPGMAITSSSGDSGFMARQPSWPANLTTVTAVGGTSLYANRSNKRGFTELAWNGAGSGCQPGLGAAVGQYKRITKFCGGHRAVSDVSGVADPYTGVAVYDSYAPASGMPLGFIVVGGTSASSPFIAGMYSRAPRNSAVVGPNTIYAAPARKFHDVTIGTNYTVHACPTAGVGNPVCDARPGWDGPTGRGTPNGLSLFASKPGH